MVGLHHLYSSLLRSQRERMSLSLIKKQHLQNIYIYIHIEPAFESCLTVKYGLNSQNLADLVMGLAKIYTLPGIRRVVNYWPLLAHMWCSMVLIWCLPSIPVLGQDLFLVRYYDLMWPYYNHQVWMMVCWRRHCVCVTGYV